MNLALWDHPDEISVLALVADGQGELREPLRTSDSGSFPFVKENWEAFFQTTQENVHEQPPVDSRFPFAKQSFLEALEKEPLIVIHMDDEDRIWKASLHHHLRLT